MRRFILERTVDHTGHSGTGIVAEGLQFSDGKVAMRWRVEDKPKTTTIFDSIEDVIHLHNHEGTAFAGGTSVEWIDK